MKARLVELAGERRRFGYRRLHARVRREGVQANHKRIYRLYSDAGLSVRRRKRRHGVAIERQALERSDGPNQVWSMDFVSDALAHGRRIKVLTIVDDFSKEAIDLAVDFGISGHYVTRVLDQVARFRGYPKAFEPTKGLNLRARRWISGPTSMAFSSSGSRPANPRRTRSSRASTDASGMSA